MPKIREYMHFNSTVYIYFGQCGNILLFFYLVIVSFTVFVFLTEFEHVVGYFLRPTKCRGPKAYRSEITQKGTTCPKI